MFNHTAGTAASLTELFTFIIYPAHQQQGYGYGYPQQYHNSAAASAASAAAASAAAAEKARVKAEADAAEQKRQVPDLWLHCHDGCHGLVRW